MKINKNRTKEFVKRTSVFGFKQTELSVLFNKSARCISFYMNGQRNIPTSVWVRLEELEKKPRNELCRVVVKGTMPPEKPRMAK